jgi:hypothetical protein
MRSFGHRRRAGGETRLATTGGHAARLGSRTRGRLSIGLIRSHVFLRGRVSGWASQARGRAAMPYTGSPITPTSESPTHSLPSTSSTLEATWARGLALPVRDRPQTHHAGQSRCPEVHGSTTGGRSSTIRQRAPLRRTCGPSPAPTRGNAQHSRVADVGPSSVDHRRCPARRQTPARRTSPERRLPGVQ